MCCVFCATERRMTTTNTIPWRRWEGLISLTNTNTHTPSSSSMISQLIQSLVLCHLRYCSIIWAAATKNEIHKLQLVQNRAARLALHCSKRANIADMHTQLSWFTVEVKLSYNILTFFRNIIFNQTPEYFKQLLNTRDRHNHYTSSGYLIPPSPRTNILKHSAIYRAVMSWSSLPPHITRSQNKWTFKDSPNAADYMTGI